MKIISIHNFRENIKLNIEKLIELIDCPSDQANAIRLKAFDILEKHIERIKNNQNIILLDANPVIIARVIVYIVFQLKKFNPKIISDKEIIDLLDIKQVSIHDYYHKHIKDLYPRVEKYMKINKENQRLKDIKYTKHHFTAIKGFLRIRKIISLYFFNKIIGSNIDNNDLVLDFKNNILNNDLKIGVNQDQFNILSKLVHHSDFIKYFFDLAEIIRYIIKTCKMHNIIGANPTISYISEALEKKGINLFQSSKTFPITIAEIYDFLKQNYPEFILDRSHTKKFQSLTEQERRNYQLIIGSRIKRYVAQNIYSGKYCINGEIKCPYCLQEGFSLNTHTTRLEALQFDHIESNKIYEYTTRTFYLLFRDCHGDPEFLDKLIIQMEDECVELICTNHHNLRHSEYSKIFSYLINYDKLLSLPSSIIHLIIRESVYSYFRKQNKSKDFLKNVRKSVLGDFKKKYIIDIIYNGICPICKEFSTKNHISVFQGHHFDPLIKDTDPSYLFRLGYTCLEITKILNEQHVGFICGNCHTVMEYQRDKATLLKIYNNSNLVTKILNDYKRAIKNFRIVNNRENLIGEPFKNDSSINNEIIAYLYAISLLEDSGTEVNTNTLSEYLNVSGRAVRFFFANREELLRPFINVFQERPRTLKYYSLTDLGKKILSLLQHFREYFSQ